MNLDNLYFYDLVFGRTYKQEKKANIEDIIETIYLKIENNFDAIFKRKERLLLNENLFGSCSVELTGYAGTGLYKVYKDENLVVIGEVFLNESESKKFNKGMPLELENAYKNIEFFPAVTCIFTKKYFGYGEEEKLKIERLCKILGFAVIPVLKKHSN